MKLRGNFLDPNSRNLQFTVHSYNLSFCPGGRVTNCFNIFLFALKRNRLANFLGVLIFRTGETAKFARELNEFLIQSLSTKRKMKLIPTKVSSSVKWATKSWKLRCFFERRVSSAFPVWCGTCSSVELSGDNFPFYAREEDTRGMRI